jgi:biopolymer transport protein ExbD
MSNASAPAPEMNATPLVDVLLVLLVMIVITLPMGTHKVPLNLPQAVDRGTVHYPEVIIVGVDFDGALSLDGEHVDSIDSLERSLRAVAALNPQPKVEFHPDRRGPYERVAQAMAAAQRARVASVGLRQQPY